MMEKMNGETLNIVGDNIQRLKEIFPEVFNEDKVDFEKLEEILGEYKDKGTERYNFTWPGKSKAIRIAQTSSTGTLRPCKEESKDWETTQNLYIEGDNLEVLKLLQKSYYGKVKLIYIDPPYNTGKDFVYKDNFKDNIENYLAITGQRDEEGNRISTNSETNGSYHSNWLNMMYPRLKLAKNLLKEDGIVFISIDDNEMANLKKICDEIFGEGNFIANVIWERAYSPVNLKKHFSESHDFILCYAKNIEKLVCNGLKRDEEGLSRYKNPDNDPRGLWKAGDLSVGPIIEEKVYEITTPSGRKVMPPKGRCWLLTKSRYEEFLKDNRIWFGEEGNNVPATKRFLSEVKDSVTPMTIWKYSEVGHSQEAKQELKKLFSNKSYFDYPKGVKLMKRILELYTNNNNNDIVLDFFSGSATMAHAVLELNSEDKGNRKFIMVQIPEKMEERTEAFRDGYKTICEIGKERIRRAGKKIKEENKYKEGIQDLDIGFKVFKLDSSNINRWDSSYDQDLETNLLSSIDNVKEGRSEEDILYEILLKYGIDLNMPIEEHDIAGKKVFDIGFGAIIACLDEHISLDVVEGIGKLKEELSPDTCRVVFMDNGFASDSVKTNAVQILKRFNIKDVKSI